MFFLDISVDFNSSDKAKSFFASIKPELGEEYFRSKTRISQKSSKILFEVSASDKTALRASLNSIMKPLILFKEVEEL